MEGNVEDFIDLVFLNPPVGRKQIVVSFQIENLKQLFQELVHITTEGMKILFGNGEKVNLSNLSSNDMTLLGDYFLSFGIELHWRKYHIMQVENLYNQQQENTHVQISFEKITNLTPNLSVYHQDLDFQMIQDYNNINSNVLKDYKFKIRVHDEIYVMFYNIF